MRNTVILAILLLLSTPSFAKPHANIGPLGEWVSNGRWLMKVESVKVASSKAEFQSLSWTKAIAGRDGQEFADQVQRLVFSKKGSLLELKVSFKNPTKATQSIGHDMPPWYVRCDDGQEVHNSGAIPTGAERFMHEHLPRLSKVKAGETLTGRMTFVLPAERKPKLLFFKAAPSIEKFAGKSETLVSRLGAQSSRKVKPLTPNRPKAAWKSNELWKMRLTDYRLVPTFQEYKALPWTDRLSGKRREKHLSYVERNVYKKGGQVALVTLQVKNLSSSKVAIGYTTPFWRLHSKDGKSLRLGGVYQQEIGWSLAGGMPKSTLLNSKATAGGTFGFFLPKGCLPSHLDFEAPGKLSKKYGKPGSLRFKF